MQLAKATAIYAAPIPLRIILAVTFIWAGLGKIVHEVPVQGEQAALLANMGYTFAAATPAKPAPQPDPEPTPEPAPTTQPDDQATPDPAPTESAAPPLPPFLALQEQTTATAGARTPATPAYTAADFPEPQKVKSLYNLAILTYTAAHPNPAADGTTPAPIWPEWAARDHWPMTMAWVAAITELAAGLLVGVGLLTRLSALALAGIMLTAAWLTQLGPAIQSGTALFGFLPDYPVWDTQAWQPLLWQLALFAAALALACAGPGSLAIDSAPAGDDDEDDELNED